MSKLAEAADPAVSSFAVFHDETGELFIWGMVDQELRYGDQVAFNAEADFQRPGAFQVEMTGVGNLSVYKNHVLIGCLENNSLVAAHHDVLWEGPVYKLLKSNLRSTLADQRTSSRRTIHVGETAQLRNELLVRWQNAVCRLLLKIQRYGHGGGLLIVPHCPAEQLNVKYQVRYDRLPRALFGLAQHEHLNRQTVDCLAQDGETGSGTLPFEVHSEAVKYQQTLNKHKSEAMGCIGFIASLSRVDGFVVLDRSLVVHGFGVEARSFSEPQDVYIADDANATPRFLRQASLSQFGTRHRAMVRYCNEHPGSLGFVISQDGDVRATMRVRDRIVLWENINVQIAFRHENHDAAIEDVQHVTGLFQSWGESLARLRSA